MYITILQTLFSNRTIFRIQLKFWVFKFRCSIDADENLVESEYEDDDEIDEKQTTEPATKISWLLQIALENLGVTVSSYIVSCICYVSYRNSFFFFLIYLFFQFQCNFLSLPL